MKATAKKERSKAGEEIGSVCVCTGSVEHLGGIVRAYMGPGRQLQWPGEGWGLSLELDPWSKSNCWIPA